MAIEINQEQLRTQGLSAYRKFLSGLNLSETVVDTCAKGLSQQLIELPGNDETVRRLEAGLCSLTGVSLDELGVYNFRREPGKKISKKRRR